MILICIILRVSLGHLLDELAALSLVPHFGILQCFDVVFYAAHHFPAVEPHPVTFPESLRLPGTHKLPHFSKKVVKYKIIGGGGG